MDEEFREARQKKVKPGRTKRNLTSVDKANIVTKQHMTTVFDFLYRMRIRSNYDDADMYIFGQSDATEASWHYANLLKLTRALVSLGETIVQQRIGNERLLALKGQILRKRQEIN